MTHNMSSPPTPNNYSPKDQSYLDEISRNEINQALQELESLKLDGATAKDFSINPSNSPDAPNPSTLNSSAKRKKPTSAHRLSKKNRTNTQALRSTLENRLMVNDQIAKKIHEKSKNIELENQRLRERMEQMDAAISGKVRTSELLKRLDDQEVMIQELTSYCESLESKCSHIESMYKSKDHHERTRIALKTQQQRIQYLEGKCNSVQRAYQELLNVKVDRFLHNWGGRSESGSTKGRSRSGPSRSASRSGSGSKYVPAAPSQTVTQKKQKQDSSQELIIALRERLNGLMHERTLEHNMHNSVLFELEAQVAKWYSECKLLKQQLHHLRMNRQDGENVLDYV